MPYMNVVCEYANTPPPPSRQHLRTNSQNFVPNVTFAEPPPRAHVICGRALSATKASINGIVNHIYAIVLSAKVYFYERLPPRQGGAEEVGSKNQKRI